MMLTEDQARKCVCPLMSRRAAAAETSGSYLLEQRCAASKCMAWREGEPKNVFGKEADVIPQKIAQGYCGLAGKP